MRQMHATLVQALQSELAVGQQWSVYDMRGAMADLVQNMKTASAEQGALWADVDKKVNYQW